MFGQFFDNYFGSCILIFQNCFRLRMQMMGRINAMLEKGWKMTNASCPKCNGTTMAEPKPQIETLYCPKEDKTFPYDFERLEPEQQEHQRSRSSDEEEYFEEVVQQMNKVKAQKPPINNKVQENPYDFDKIYLNEKEAEALNRTNDVSKRIGEKLLQGWTMLNQSCDNCYAPIMRSKNMQKVCFGCGSTEKKQVKAKAAPLATIRPYDEQQKVEPQKERLLLKGQPEVKQLKKENKEKPKKQQEKKEEKKHQEKKEEQKEKNKEEKKKEKQESEDDKQPNQKEAKTNGIITRIEKKSLLYLQGRIAIAITVGDLADIQKTLQLVYKIKHEFK